jgi:hypothetical protein
MANNAMNNYYGILGSAAGAMATGAAELYGGANIPRSGGIVPRQTPQQSAKWGEIFASMGRT